MTTPARPSITSNRRLAEAAVLLVTVIWGVNYVVVKAALDTAPPIAFQAIRFTFAALLLLAVLRWREGSVGLPRAELLPLAALGIVGFAAYQVLWSIGLVQTTAGNSALIVASTPVLTLLISAAIGTDHLSASRALGSAIAFGGVFVIVAASATAPGGFVFGDVLTLAASLCWAIYMSFGANVLRRLPPLRATAWTVTFGAVAMWPLGAVELAHGGRSDLDAGAWLAVAYSGLLSVAFANVLVSNAIRLLGPVRSSAYQFLSPVVAVVVGAAWLGEPIGYGELAGGALIGLGIVVLRRSPPGGAAVERPTVGAAGPAR